MSTEKKDTVPSAPMTIWQAIPHIMGAVAPIAKDRKNASQGYSFRGVDDIYSTLNLLLARAGVSIIPSVTHEQRSSFATPKGTQMFRCILRVRFTLTASDGSFTFADVEGEAMDSGDKATPKALSMAYKYMAFQVFCIPTGEKIDTENESPEVANERDPDELAEEHRQALVGAKDVAGLRKAASAIKADHDAKKITDAHRAVLLKVFGERSNEVKPQGAVAA